MPVLDSRLILDRCPYCNIDKPNLTQRGATVTTADYRNQNKRQWFTYGCETCGGLITAGRPEGKQNSTEIYPKVTSFPDTIPERARHYLKQASDTLHSPSVNSHVRKRCRRHAKSERLQKRKLIRAH